MGRGNANARVMVVLDGLLEQDGKRGKYMTGKAERLFIAALGEAGIDLDDVYFTGLVKCSAPEDRPHLPDEAKACVDILMAEIDVVKPEIIVPMGNLGLKELCGVTGITKNRGRIFEREGTKCFPIYSPHMVLKQPKYMDFFIKDVVNLRSVLDGETPSDIVEIETEYKYGETYADTVAELERFIALPSGTIVSFDLETIKANPFISKVSMGKTSASKYPDSNRPKIVAVGLSDKEGYGFAFPLHHRQTPFSEPQLQHIEDLLRELFSREDLEFTGHNAKFDSKWIAQKLKTAPVNYKWDSLLLHYMLITEEKGTHGLKQLAWLETDMGGYDDALDKVKPKGEDEGNYDLIEWDVLKYYLCGDVDCGLRITNKYISLLRQDDKKQWMWDNIMLPGTNALMDMEINGAYIDREWLEVLKEAYPREIQRLEDKLKQFPEVLEVERENLDMWREREQIAVIKKANRTEEQQAKFEKYKKYDPSKGGHLFNFGSTAQLQELLFDRMGLSTVVLTDKGKPSTNDDSMKYMKKQHPICEMMLEFRKARHLYNNFVVGMESMVDDNGLIHPTYHTFGTVTGRLSSSEPNAQQFPRHVNVPTLFQYHHEIKSLFSSRYGKDGVILQIDYSQLELRILGVVTGEPELMRLYKDGADLHKEVASTAFGVPIEEVTKDQRTAAKKIQFGVVYQESPRGLSDDLRSEGIDLSPEDCERFIANYFKRFPKVEKWVKDIKRFAKRNKYVQTIFGRVRHLEGIASTENSIASECERQSVNMPIQSTGSDCTVQAIIQMNKWLKENNKRSKLIITVHDSIVLDCPKDEVYEVGCKIKHIMENLGEYHDFYKFLGDMPLLAELEIGYDYGHSFECGTEDLRDVDAFLQKCINKSKVKEHEHYAKILVDGGTLPPYIDPDKELLDECIEELMEEN